MSKILLSMLALGGAFLLGLSAHAYAAGSAEEMEPVSIELPMPGFGGTPLDYWSENLEQEDFRDRAPFMAPKGTIVVSRNKPVTASVRAPLRGNLGMLVDGNKDFDETNVVEMDGGPQWVQIDLGTEHDVFAVILWHYNKVKRVYFDVIVLASNDPDFKTGTTTLHNNDADNRVGLGAGKEKEYIENNKGRLIDAKGVKARYLRCYSNGNSSDGKNHYLEIEVFGRPTGAKPGMQSETESGVEKAPIKIELPMPGFG